MGCIGFVPLAQGLLTDRYLGGIPGDSRAAQGKSLNPALVNDETIGRLRALNDIAAARGQSLAQLALSWVLRDQRVTSALIGASSVAQRRRTSRRWARPRSPRRSWRRSTRTRWSPRASTSGRSAARRRHTSRRRRTGSGGPSGAWRRLAGPDGVRGGAGRLWGWRARLGAARCTGAARVSSLGAWGRLARRVRTSPSASRPTGRLRARPPA